MNSRIQVEMQTILDELDDLMDDYGKNRDRILQLEQDYDRLLKEHQAFERWIQQQITDNDYLD